MNGRNPSMKLKGNNKTHEEQGMKNNFQKTIIIICIVIVTILLLALISVLLYLLM